MENKIDCMADLKVMQAAEVINGCVERIQADMGLSVLEIALAIDLAAGKYQRIRADLYAQAFAAEATKPDAEKEDN